MKTSHLLVLTIVLAALLLLAWLRQRREIDADMAKPDPDASLAVLTPPDFDSDRVAEIVVGRGAADAPPALHLRKREGRWTLASAWDAPVDGDRVARLLKALSGLRGDLRSEVASSHAKYRTDDAGALRLALGSGGADGQTSDLLDLRLGKGVEGEWGLYYARRAGDDASYAVAGDFSGLLGQYGGDGDVPARADWLANPIASFDRSQARRVEIVTPERRIDVAHTNAEPAAPAAEPPPESGSEGDAAAPVPAQEPKPAWRVAAGGRAGASPLKPEAVDRILAALSFLRVRDVVDPDGDAAKRLEAPSYALVVDFPDGEGGLRLDAAKPDADGADALLRVGGAPSPVYTIASSTFDSLFPRGNAFFDLNPPRPDTAAVNHVEYRRGRHAFSFERRDGAWSAVAGPGFPLKSATLETLLAAAADWKPEDYADAGDRERFGLVEPSARATLVTPEGARAFSLGEELPGGGWYVDAGDGDGQPLAISAPDRARLFPKFSDLFDLRLFDEMLETTREITIARDGRPALALRREGEGAEARWTLVPEGGQPRDADAAKASAWAEKVLALACDDLFEASSSDAGRPWNEWRLSVVGQRKADAAWGAAVDGRHPAKARDRVATTLPEASVREMLAALSELAPEEFPAPEPAAPTPDPTPTEPEPTTEDNAG